MRCFCERFHIGGLRTTRSCLLYSELPAGGYFHGLVVLYNIPNRHDIPAARRNQISRKEIEPYPTIWRFTDGKFVPDPVLYAELLKNASDN
jgi:hypothetical protein